MPVSLVMPISTACVSGHRSNYVTDRVSILNLAWKLNKPACNVEMALLNKT